VTMNSNLSVTATFIQTGGGGISISGTWKGYYHMTTEFSYYCLNLTTVSYSGIVTMVIKEDILGTLTGAVNVTNMTVADVDYSTGQCTLAALSSATSPIADGGGMVFGTSVQVNTDLGPNFGSYWGTNQMLYFAGTLNGSITNISGTITGLTDGGTGGTTGTFSVTKQQ
jgi:hypothetical protein